MKNWIIFSILMLSIVVRSGFSSGDSHIVDYRIKARLSPEDKTVYGEQILTWRNTGDAPVADLQFHLYLNAFKNNRSTFMKESGGSHRGFEVDEEGWGYTEIRKIGIQGGADLTAAMEYIQPDDQNPDDQTVMRIPLPEPLPAGGTITLDIVFQSKLPQVFARAGYKGNFFMVAQWFPKIGVWENGAWNCHQYHSNSEFYADFGVFEVEITVPKEFVVGATGKRIQKVENEDGSITYTHHQEKVHDFAWTACPDFLEIRKPFTLDRPPVQTEMILLIHESHRKLKERFEESLRNGLEFYSQSYGAYPYETITLVDPPTNAMGAGGMEYPTLFTSIGSWLIPDGLRLPELVTIHEFGHGYWYGMVASNEFEEAWLDEGINSYSEIKAMNRYYGHDRSLIDLGGLKMSDLSYSRIAVMGLPQLDPIMTRSWDFYSGGSYGSNVYAKAALTLLTLEGYLGEDVMAEVMKTYFERWKFRHPRSEDFFAVAEEASGKDLDWFFDQFFRTSGKLDYSVGRVRSVEIAGEKGFFDGKLVVSDKSELDGTETTYKNEVVIRRKGDLIFPQEILIVFENGEEIRETWDGLKRWKRLEYIRPHKLKMAQIDPENKIPLDINLMNNSRLLKPNKTPILKCALEITLTFQELLTLISF
jgi:hypothetical protein